MILCGVSCHSVVVFVLVFSFEFKMHFAIPWEMTRFFNQTSVKGFPLFIVKVVRVSKFR